MTFTAGLISLVLASCSGIEVPPEPAPVHLTSDIVDGGVRFHVIGAASKQFQGRFLLEVQSGSGNQSRHEGSVELQQGDRVTLSSVTVGVPPSGSWRARLRVEPVGAPTYEQVLTSH